MLPWAGVGPESDKRANSRLPGLGVDKPSFGVHTAGLTRHFNLFFKCNKFVQVYLLQCIKHNNILSIKHINPLKRKLNYILHKHALPRSSYKYSTK